MFQMLQLQNDVSLCPPGFLSDYGAELPRAAVGHVAWMIKKKKKTAFVKLLQWDCLLLSQHKLANPDWTKKWLNTWESVQLWN